MQRNQISFKSKNPHDRNLPNKYNLISDADRVVELQFQLKQAHSQIEALKQTNRNILEKLSYYERKCEDKKIIEQELQFRKQQEKTIQQHLDHYHVINQKLKAKVSELQKYIGNQQLVKSANLSTHEYSHSHLQNSLDYKSGNKQKGLQIDSSKYFSRKSIGEINKQNHHLTPKNRVSYDFQKIQNKQIDPLLKIKERRKVFL